MNYYEYFLYRIYKVKKITEPDEFVDAWYAILLLALLESFNALTLSGFLHIMLSIPEFINSKLIVGVTMLILFGINYQFFLRKKRYKLIEEKYNNESRKQNITGTIWTLSYIILTVVLFIVVVLLKWCT